MERKKLQELFNIRESSDFEKTKSIISNGISLRGYNFWILVCSTVLASIGLDTNSTAVIIGAMLISPLMSPILGVGLGLAIHDRQILFKSLRNLGIATVLSLVVSVFYFFISPLGDPTPALQSRTFPTLLDVLIALFGGVAGIVSISRADQTTAIPGVAIATALMPPLCTAGFGIATGNWNYFFGAFYLFFLNAVFISLATFLIVRHLHFPEKKFVSEKNARQYQRRFIAISVIALAPSVYFLYTVYQDQVTKHEIETLVLRPIRETGNEILKWEVVSKDSGNLIKVYHSGQQLGDSLKIAIDSSLRNHKMGFYHLLSMRVNLTKEEVNALSAEVTKQMFQQMHLEESRLPDTAQAAALDTAFSLQILREVKAAFSFVDTLAGARLTMLPSAKRTDTLPVILFKTRRSAGKAQIAQLYSFLRTRMKLDTLILIRQ